MEQLKKSIRDYAEKAKDKTDFINELKEFIHNELSEIKQPVDFVRWIPVDKVEPNDYNPNSVAKVEMGLLYKSIKHDGYTQPVVTVKSHKYVVKIYDLLLSLSEQNLNDKELWNYLKRLQSLQSHIRLDLLTQTEASILMQALTDIQSEHSNPKETMERKYLNGLKINGVSVECTLTTVVKHTKEHKECFVGRLQALKNVHTWHVLSACTNLSKSIKALKSSTIILMFHPISSIMESGMILKIDSSLIIGDQKKINSFLNLLTDQSTQLEQEEITWELKDESTYCIVDGFHRYFTCKTNKDIYEQNKGRLPCVVIEKDINERMAATVRHNRARGTHSVTGMGNMVFEMLQNGWADEEICNHLGMEPEEILKLKHITGFSKLFKDVEYNKSWQTKRMIKLKIEQNGIQQS